MRTAFGLLIVLAGLSCSQRPIATISRLDLPFSQRLDLPQKVAPASIRLKEFIGFIGTSFKVPLLVETSVPEATIRIEGGTYSARQLLDDMTRQLSGVEWKDEGGVAHIYGKNLVSSPGNLLNVHIPHFVSPGDVGEFMYLFRPCVSSVIHGYGCQGGAYAGFQLPKLKRGQLPDGRSFDNAVARNILLAALQSNGRFYVLIAFPNDRPKLTSDYPFINWFAESLEQDEPSPMWVQPEPVKN